MPGFDQTGPAGQGPMTGRRMGRCTNYGEHAKGQGGQPATDDAAGSPDFIPGRGFGRGRGFGWRGGNGPAPGGGGSRAGWGGPGRGFRNRNRGGN